MPSLIVHDLFGRDLNDRLPDLVEGGDTLDAFLLGNQGPDVIFYARAVPSLRAWKRFGSDMHRQKTAELIAGLAASLSILEGEDRNIGRAYMLGFLGHYALDSTVHPLVYHHQFALCSAGIEGLDEGAGSEVHAIIETDFDEMALHVKLGETTATFDPSRRILQARQHTIDVISSMFVYVALTVYGQIVPKDMFTRCLVAYRSIQRLVYTNSGVKRKILTSVEKIFRDHSIYDAWAHRPIAHDVSLFDNRDHEVWENPFTSKMSMASFWDLYDEALDKMVSWIPIVDAANFDLAAARAIVQGFDFSGRPSTALLLSVEDK